MSLAAFILPLLAAFVIGAANANELRDDSDDAVAWLSLLLSIVIIISELVALVYYVYHILPLTLGR